MLFRSVAVAVQGVLMSPYAPALQKGINRTFGDKRTARQRTSGRSDQWKVAYYAFSKSLESMVRGYGPGLGAIVYAKYSREVEDVKYGVGKKVLLHSLFMQIGVEAGLVGLGLLFLWLGILAFKIITRVPKEKILFPLICFFGYVFIVITV